jgi:hypothetical protein
MKKSLSYISFVAAVALFSGCGSSSTTPPEGGGADTIAPVFSTSVAYNFTLDEGTNRSVTIAVTDNVTAVADIALSSDDVTITGSSFTYTAPTVTTDTDFTVTVTAEDEAGLTKTQVYTFSVTNVPNQPDVKVAPVGDKIFNNLGSNFLRGPIPSSTLIWRDLLSADDGVYEYDEAETYCASKSYNSVNFRLPTRSELFNIIDYTRTTDLNASLVDGNFTNNGGSLLDGSAKVSTVWAKTDRVDTNKYFVHTVSGIDGLETNTSAVRAVICVQGDSEINHTTIDNGATVTDSTTGYIWETVNTASDTATTFADADSCSGNFELPTINDLRSIFDYSNNTLEELVPAGNAISVWSSTPYPKNVDNQHYVMQLSNATGSITIADNTTGAHYVTCVKKP